MGSKESRSTTNSIVQSEPHQNQQIYQPYHPQPYYGEEYSEPVNLVHSHPAYPRTAIQPHIYPPELSATNSYPPLVYPHAAYPQNNVHMARAIPVVDPPYPTYDYMMNDRIQTAQIVPERKHNFVISQQENIPPHGRYSETDLSIVGDVPNTTREVENFRLASDASVDGAVKREELMTPRSIDRYGPEHGPSYQRRSRVDPGKQRITSAASLKMEPEPAVATVIETFEVMQTWQKTFKPKEPDRESINAVDFDTIEDVELIPIENKDHRNRRPN